MYIVVFKHGRPAAQYHDIFSIRIFDSFGEASAYSEKMNSLCVLSCLSPSFSVYELSFSDLQLLYTFLSALKEVK